MCTKNFFPGDNRDLYLVPVEEAARARMKCVWVTFEELAPILTAISHCIKSRVRFIELVSRVF